MSVISNVMRAVDYSKITWECDGVLVEKHLALAKYYAKVVVLKDCSGIAIVLDEDKYGSENAVIFNADGSLRFKLQMPDFIEDGYFYSLSHDDTGLECVVSDKERDWWSIVDENTGEYCRQWHEWR